MKAFLISPTKVRFDDRFPDLDTSYVYDQLRYYSLLCKSVSTVGVQIIGGSVVAVRNHKHAKIAAELKLSKVQIVLEQGTEAELLRACEQDVEVAVEPAPARFHLKWHVLFFERRLSQQQQVMLKEIVERCFVDELFARYPSETDSIHPPKLFFSHGESCAEFQGIVPMLDHPWAALLRESLEMFSRNEMSIRSMNGLKWS